MNILRKMLVYLNKIKPFSYIKISIDAQLQFVKFCIVGFSNTLISYLIYFASLLLFRRLDLFEDYDYYIAQILMFILSVTWSFYWNNRFVFKQNEDEQRNILSALAKTYVAYSLTGLFLNNILLFLWVDLLGLSEFIAPILNLCISVPVNFILNKFWAFRARSRF